MRNHDVLAFGHTPAGAVVVGVEGKVNESLDATVAQKYRQAGRLRELARERHDEPRTRRQRTTNLDARIDALLDAIAGRRVADAPDSVRCATSCSPGSPALWLRPMTTRSPPHSSCT